MNESARPKPRLLRGFRDLFGAPLVRRRRMIDTVVSVYERYGFTPLETPAVEYLDVLGKYLPDSDRPDGGVFAFRDDSDEWAALRYDLTAPLSRVVAQYPELPLPFRRHQVGPVFRQEKPGPGRFREFTQCDFDTVGSASMAADAEVATVLADALEALGIRRGDYVVRVNDRKVLNGLLGRAGVTDAAQATTVLRAVDKLDRIGLDGVAELLGPGRRDPSGDFTPGAGLSSDQVTAVRRYLELPRGERGPMLDALAELVAGSPVGEEGLAELRQIDALLTATGYAADRVVFDPTVIRGLAYYTGPVFEAELTFEIVDDDGQPRRFGSVAGGGRYDDLVERFLGRLVPATGASIGVDRLLAALEHLERKGAGDRLPSVLVLVLDRDRVPDYAALAASLRAEGIAAEVFLGEGGLRAQMKYADRRRVAAVVIEGEDERKAGTVAIKDLAMGMQLAGAVEDRAAWKKDRPAQRTVPKGQMAAVLREILSPGGEEERSSA